MPGLSPSLHFSLNRATGVPVFKQIMDQVKFLIACGRLKGDQSLPSTRSLAAHLGINPMTVSKAYGFLAKEGVVEYRPGKSVVVRQVLDPSLEQEKREQMRRHLASCVMAARQLGLDSGNAVAIFKEMLTREPETSIAEAPDDGWQNW